MVEWILGLYCLPRVVQKLKSLYMLFLCLFHLKLIFKCSWEGRKPMSHLVVLHFICCPKCRVKTIWGKKTYLQKFILLVQSRLLANRSTSRHILYRLELKSLLQKMTLSDTIWCLFIVLPLFQVLIVCNVCDILPSASYFLTLCDTWVSVTILGSCQRTSCFSAAGLRVIWIERSEPFDCWLLSLNVDIFLF